MTVVTEEDAKGKWCPFSRVASNTKPVRKINRFSNGARPEGTFCIGSACMAWRWDAEPARGIYRPTGQLMWIRAGRTYACEPSRPIWMTDAWSWDDARGWWTTGEPVTDRGYCGLAGRPS